MAKRKLILDVTITQEIVRTQKIELDIELDGADIGLSDHVVIDKYYNKICTEAEGGHPEGTWLTTIKDQKFDVKVK